MPSQLRGQHLHFDPASGIAGDMCVAALVDAGVPARAVVDAVAKLGVRGLTVRFERRRRGAFVGRGFVVGVKDRGHAHDHDHDHPHDHAHDHRDYAEIRRLLRRARLSGEVRDLAASIFARIAEVEARMHGVPVAKVAFHEVGAWDSIADVVGAAAAIAWLAPVSISSTIPVVGTGMVSTAHGPVPVPAPATAALLEGIPVLAEGAGELTTPTGAAILAQVVDRFGAAPPMRLRAQGYGAGTRQLSDRPNVLRATIGEPLGGPLGEPDPAAPHVLVIETNLDDMSPQLLPALIAGLLAAGALDAWATPVLMKKGRPGFVVGALAEPGLRGAVEAAFFAHSPTLGVRTHAAARSVLARSHIHVATPAGRVRVKVAARDGEVLGVTPEFEDVVRRASAAGRPVRWVHAQATVAAWQAVGGAKGTAKGGAKTKRARARKARS